VSALTEIRVPDIGDFSGVEVIEILVAPGQEIKADDSLITLESDKATMEIPAPQAGTVREIRLKVGDKVKRGDLILLLDAAALTGAGASPPPEQAAETLEEKTGIFAPQSPEPEEPEEPPRLPGEKAPKRPPFPGGVPLLGRRAHASPAVRRFARELGVDLATVTGSGPKGRITKEDVQNHVKKRLAGGAQPIAPAGLPFQLPAAPEIDFSKFGEIETKPLGRIKKISGAHLQRAWLTIPHVTQFDEADISELESFRKGQQKEAEKRGVKLTFMPFLLKAVAKALREMPQFNASLAADGEGLVLKKYVHIGVAVDTPNGLMVPVLRDVDKKGVYDLAADLMTISDKARAGKLTPGDLQGGCFSISSLGGIGGTHFTPIVNAPEVAILGVSRSAMKPVWNGQTFEPKLILPLALSYDHRVIDGAEGVRFTTLLGGLLGDIRRLLL
jgi:pyruvate dehydrogenase E2 component (dihydrolipoamide acetyltransferase)